MKNWGLNKIYTFDKNLFYMKNIVLTLILSLLSSTAFTQNIKYSEEKNLDLSKMLAKVQTNSAFGFKNYLVKTFVINTELGYTKDEELEGAKQNAFISVTRKAI